MVKDKKKDYLEQLGNIKKRGIFREARKQYRKYRPRETWKGTDRYFKGKAMLRYKKVDPIKTAALAYSLMQEGIEMRNVQYSLVGAQLYEKIGKGKRAIPRLLKAAEKRTEQGYRLKEKYTSKIKNFIKRNTGEREQGEGGLEKRFGIFVAFIIGGIALSLGSLTVTGNAISNLTQTTPGLLGIFLFIAGLVGMFFCSRRK